jgi:hypothetical protein
MVAVAVVAVLIAMPVRRSRFLTIARFHEAQAGISVYYLEDNGRISLTSPLNVLLRTEFSSV